MSTDSKPLQRLLTAKQVAELTGLPLWTVRHLTRQGKGPPYVPFGKRYMFPENGVAPWWDRWIKAHTRSSNRSGAKERAE
ncbi:MAG: helix-turn-helix domain-containing protein [Gemmatimonadaceae bacterium]